MTAREKVRRAVRHLPGPVPLDIGGTACSGMHVTCVAAMRDYYGLEKRPVRVVEPYQMLGGLDEDLIAVLGVDTTGVGGRTNLFGYYNENYKEWSHFGLNLLVPGDFQVTSDGRGGYYTYPEGDLSAPPSGHMPEGGFYFDTIVRQEPIDEDRLNVADNLEEFEVYSEDSLKRFEDSVKEGAATGRAMIGGLSGTGLGDIALVPGPFMKHPKGIRDIEEWYVSTGIRRGYLKEIFDRQTDIALTNLNMLASGAWKDIDAVFLCGTDFGTQISTFCSPSSFRDLYLPYYRKMTDFIHANTDWTILKHTCGAVEPLLNDLIEAGFDAINPVQCSARGMEPETLKAKYGDKLTFWGGGVDTQRVLPFGTPNEVRAQSLERLRIFGENGGFVFAAVHNIQAGTPSANIAAMALAVKEYNRG